MMTDHSRSTLCMFCIQMKQNMILARMVVGPLLFLPGGHTFAHDNTHFFY